MYRTFGRQRYRKIKKKKPDLWQLSKLTRAFGVYLCEFMKVIMLTFEANLLEVLINDQVKFLRP